MPPGDSGNTGRIQVQLAFLQGQDSAAFLQMVESMKTAAEFMKAFKSMDFASQTRRMADATKAMREETTRLGEALKNMEEVKSDRGVILPRGEARDETKARAEENRKKAEQDAKDHADREKERLHQTDQEREADRRRERMGLPPSGGGPQNAWYNQIESLNPNLSGVELPRFGEMTVQDTLNFMRDRSLRRAERADTEAQRDAEGERAAMFDQMSRGAGQVGLAHAAFRQIQRHVTQPLQGITSMFENPGAALGYGRDEINLPFGLGISSPFSAAGGEGARQAFDQLRLRWRGGINSEQAAQINAAVAGAGFSGATGTDIRMQMMAPQVQRYGVNPEALVPFLQTLRTGSSNIRELNDALSNLGEGARIAQMDVNSYTQSLAQVGEAMQSMGGTMVGGAQLGQSFSASTGLNPQVATTLMNSPIVKSYVAANSSLPSTIAGAASPLQQQRSMEQAVYERFRAFQGQLSSTSTPIYDAAGNIIDQEVTSGEDAAYAMTAAQFPGMNQEQIRAIVNRKGSGGTANFMAAQRRMLSSYENATDNQSDARRDFVDKLNRRGVAAAGQMHTSGRAAAYSQNAREKYKYDPNTGEVLRLNNGWQVDKDATEQMKASVGPLQLDSRISIDQLRDMAKQSGVTDKEWQKKVGDKFKNDPEEAIKAAGRLVSEQVKDANDAAGTQIAFTGPAAKFFKTLVERNRGIEGADALTKTSNATSNAGSNSLSWNTNAAATVNPYGP